MQIMIYIGDSINAGVCLKTYNSLTHAGNSDVLAEGESLSSTPLSSSEGPSFCPRYSQTC